MVLFQVLISQTSLPLDKASVWIRQLSWVMAVWMAIRRPLATPPQLIAPMIMEDQKSWDAGFQAASLHLGRGRTDFVRWVSRQLQHQSDAAPHQGKH